MKPLVLFFSLTLLTGAVFAFPADVAAQVQGGGQNNGGVQSGGTNTGTQLINPLSSGTSLEGFLEAILAVVIRIGTIVIVLALVYIGFLFATSSANPDNKDKAKSALLWTVVGALILLGAQAIATAIRLTVQALGTGT